MGEAQLTVWCLLGKKAGDNTQVRALAAELGLNSVEKLITARPWELLSHLGAGMTLAGIDQRKSSDLQAPWPDIVISAGRRNEPVAQWIRQQSAGLTRLIHIGRPWTQLANWDLIITTPQYFLPQQDNILHNSMPLHRISQEDLKSAGSDLLPQLASLPRPWVAMLVGGNSGRFVVTPDKARRLGLLATNLASAAGGSVLCVESARTPRVAGDALRAQLTAPNLYYRWGSEDDNPYRGLLALADAFVVTGESMSMLGEALDTGRALYIFDVGDGAAHWWTLPHNYRYKPLSHRLAMRYGPIRMRRDIGNMQNSLVDGGAAQWLDPSMIDAAADTLRASVAKPFTIFKASGSVAHNELERTAQAVRQLLTMR